MISGGILLSEKYKMQKSICSMLCFMKERRGNKTTSMLICAMPPPPPKKKKNNIGGAGETEL